MLPLSIGLATSVLVAQSLGAVAPRQARSVAWRGLRLAAAIAVAAATALWLLRESVVGWYTGDAAVAAVALSLLVLAVPFHVADAVQGVCSFVLRGYRQTLWPMVIYGVALWGLGLGGGAWIAYNETWLGPPRGALGFWEAALVAVALTAAALVVLTAIESNRHVADR
jgi:MATE family multidrug resistance protein